MLIDPEVKDLQIELRTAKSNYPPFRSYHEGYAIIKEELDELWDEIKKKPGEIKIEHLQIELRTAKSNYPPFRSYHEGYAIIKEELDELWDEIKKKPGEIKIEHLRKEALQVAAMAARFAGDLC